MEWISVKERLPENNSDVLVINTFGIINTARYTARYGHTYFLYGWGQVEGVREVTHWMPLPEPPKQ